MTNTHQRFEETEEIEGSSNRSFAAVMTVAFAVIGLFPMLKGDEPLIPLLAVAGGFLLTGLAVPGVLSPLNRLWMKLGLLLGRIVNPIVMGLVFFLFVTPMALVMRLAGREFLALRFEPSKASYWVRRDPPGPEPESIVYPF